MANTFPVKEMARQELEDEVLELRKENEEFKDKYQLLKSKYDYLNSSGIRLEGGSQ